MLSETYEYYLIVYYMIAYGKCSLAQNPIYEHCHMNFRTLSFIVVYTANMVLVEVIKGRRFHF